MLGQDTRQKNTIWDLFCMPVSRQVLFSQSRQSRVMQPGSWHKKLGILIFSRYCILLFAIENTLKELEYYSIAPSKEALKFNGKSVRSYHCNAEACSYR